MAQLVDLLLENEELLHRFRISGKTSILKASLESGGLSIRDYRDYRGKLGTYIPKVYGVKGKNSDGYTVLHKKIGSQTIWYVPEIQMTDDSIEEIKKERQESINRTAEEEDKRNSRMIHSN